LEISFIVHPCFWVATRASNMESRGRLYYFGMLCSMPAMIDV